MSVAVKKGRNPAPAAASSGGSRKVLDPATRAQQQAQRFYADMESMRKGNLMQIDALRSSGRHSENLLRRAMQLDTAVFPQQSMLAGSSSSASVRASSSSLRYIGSEEEPVVEDLVSGGTGVLLSRGAVPSVIPGKYSVLGGGATTPSDWAAAAQRQKELKVALRELEAEMKSNELSVLSQTEAISDGILSATKFAHSDTANPSLTNLVTVIKPGSNVMGSSFRWQGTQAKSLKEEQFSWPSDSEHKFSSWPVGATKYGELSHECDVPGGSVYVQRGKGRLSKKKQLK